MLVAIKIGNSTINTAFFKNPFSSEFELLSFNTNDILKKTLDSAQFPFLNKSDNFDCIICSVVPKLTKKFQDFFRNFCQNTIIVDHKTYTGLTLKVSKPESFGADRIASSVAAYELLKKNLAVVDAGTATTITIVSKEGEILGGAIMPGLNTMNYSLREKTAQLPIVDLNSDICPLGRDTNSAILSGIVLGTVFAIEGILQAIKKEINRSFEIVLTGGYPEIISKYMTKKHLLNKYLVIEGIRLIYLKNIKV